MKKKAITEPVIAPEILQMAKRSMEPEKPRSMKRCVVCGAESIPLTGPQMDEEDLCWVCRRLKISAWRDSDQQIAAQE